jgi:predicted transcriptional regulator of viral defense system
MNVATLKNLQRLGSPFIGLTELKQVFAGSEDSRYGRVKRATADGYLTRVKRGLYCPGEALPFQHKVHPYALANRIYGPSAISLESALSFHGLIPEAVRVITSVTPRRRNYFSTPLGDYSYQAVPSQDFMTSVIRVVDGDAVYFMATPFRAIADYVYVYKKNWNTLDPLFESLRIEENDLPTLSNKEANELIAYFQNDLVSQFLLTALQGVR